MSLNDYLLGDLAGFVRGAQVPEPEPVELATAPPRQAKHRHKKPVCAVRIPSPQPVHARDFVLGVDAAGLPRPAMLATAMPKRKRHRDPVASPRRHRHVPQSIQLAVAHAPIGGINIAGKQFRGGQFVPEADLERATPEQKARVMPAEKEPTDADTIHPEGNLGVARPQMPQIQGKHMPEFLQRFMDRGIKVTGQEIEVGKLKPTQSELSRSQMDQLLTKLPPEKLSSPVIASNDGYILDGHHRWGALRLKSPNEKIKANVIDLPMKELLREAKSFPHTTYKHLDARAKPLPPIDKLPPLREPTSAEDMKTWLPEVLNHPYVKEAERLLDDDKERGNETEKQFDHLPGSTKDNPIYQPERVEKVHEPIINHFINPKAKPAPGERPKAVMLIGPFGAGKSVAGTPIVDKMMPNYTLVNPDDVKKKMPEDKGWNATSIHEESSHISKQIQKRATEEGHHILFDGSGQNGEKMERMAKEYHDQGYDVHVVHVTVPAHISAFRAARRFLENPFGMRNPADPPSRYAPLEYVYKDVDSKPDETYQRLKESPYVKSGASFDTHRPEGQPIIVNDQWNRDEDKWGKDTPDDVKKASKNADGLAADWAKKLAPLGVKVVMGGSLVSGLALPSDEHDMDVRFLYDGDREKMVPEIEKATGLKLRKSIKVGGESSGTGEPESDAHMIEGKMQHNGTSFDVEGQLRNTRYTGWAKYYPMVLKPEELAQARAKKKELKGDKKAYKAYKNGILAEVQKRVRERGMLPKPETSPTSPASSDEKKKVDAGAKPSMKPMSELGKDTIGTIAGALPDAEKVEINRWYTPPDGSQIISIWHKHYQASRYLETDDNGVRYIKNKHIEIDPRQQGKGLGLKIFGSQVDEAIKHGFGYITCHAAMNIQSDPDDSTIGYYVWPRYGYDESLDDIAKQGAGDSRVAEEARQKFPGAKSVLDIMETPEGRAWWKENGTDMETAKFDLTEGSRSRKIFDAYRAERKKMGTG